MIKKENKVGKAIAVGVAGLLVGGLAGAGIVATTMEPEVKTVEVEVPVTVTETVTETVEVPVNVTVEKIVEVEDKELALMLCDRLVYDDLSECEEEVRAEDAALKLAIAEIEENYADELEDFDIVKDEDDVELVTIYSDFEDVEVVKSNFDRDKYVFNIEAKIDDDGDKSKVTFTVECEDGETEILNIE
jgi:hypothetical protein